jgi:hypothetical protein
MVMQNYIKRWHLFRCISFHRTLYWYRPDGNINNRKSFKLSNFGRDYAYQARRLRSRRLMFLFFVSVVFVASMLLIHITQKIVSRESKPVEQMDTLERDHHDLPQLLRGDKSMGSVVRKDDAVLVKVATPAGRVKDMVMSTQQFTAPFSLHNTLRKVPMKNDANNVTKLKFVYHIGPMKTGSTTLQSAHIEDKDVLKLDGYLYGLNGLLLANQCLDRIPNKCGFSAKWQRVFLPYLTEHSHENLFLSDEMFGVMADWDGNWKLLEDTIGGTWDLQFIVTYRRFFEWFVSFYYQAHRYAMSEERITIKWPSATTNKNPMQNRYRNIIPPISAYFEMLQREKSSFNVYVRRWGDTFLKMHPMEVQKNKFEKHYPDVKIFNFHQEPDNLVGSFYCNVFPGPQSHACKHRRHVGTPDSTNQNLSGSHNYDMLSVVAYHSNLIKNRDLPRPAVAEAARRYQEEVLNLSDKDFPLICMSPQQLSNLLESSLEFERRVLPEWFELPQGEQQHRAQFDKYVSEHRFCSINANEAILDERWRKFFESLNSTNVGRVRDIYGHVKW